MSERRTYRFKKWQHVPSDINAEAEYNAAVEFTWNCEDEITTLVREKNDYIGRLQDAGNEIARLTTDLNAVQLNRDAFAEESARFQAENAAFRAHFDKRPIVVESGLYRDFYITALEVCRELQAKLAVFTMLLEIEHPAAPDLGLVRETPITVTMVGEPEPEKCDHPEYARRVEYHGTEFGYRCVICNTFVKITQDKDAPAPNARAETPIPSTEVSAVALEAEWMDGTAGATGDPCKGCTHKDGNRCVTKSKGDLYRFDKRNFEKLPCDLYEYFDSGFYTTGSNRGGT